MSRKQTARKSRPQTAPKPPKPKPSPAAPPPNFPQHELPEPYARLLSLGNRDEDDPVYDEIAEQLKQGDVPAAASKLAELAQDQTFYDYYEFYRNEDQYFQIETRYWVPLHAVRLLERLGEGAAGVVESLLPLLDEEDDWVREEMPFFYAAVGKPAIEPLARALTDAEEETILRAGAGESLAELAEQRSEYRAEVISILEQALTAEEEDPELAGFLIGNLLDLGAKESVPLIEQAFKEGRVDEFVVQMADVEDHFDLPRVTPRRRLDYDFWDAEDEDEAEEDEAEEWLPVNIPTSASAEPRESGGSVPYVAPPKVGRNDLCPCGSGKKYKKCCGA